MRNTFKTSGSVRAKYFLSAAAALCLAATAVTARAATAGNDAAQVAATATAEVGDSIYNNKAVEVPAQYKKGTQAMLKFISDNIKYPKGVEAKGLVVVTFVVDQKGQVTDVKAVRSPHPALSAEAVRVIKKLKGWTPATQNGRPVSVSFTLPVRFDIR